MRAGLRDISLKGCIAFGFLAVFLSACSFGRGPESVTGEFEGRDCSLYAVDENWLVYEWSPPVSTSRPLHLVARNLASGVETELDSDWNGTGIDLDDGYLLYGKKVSRNGEVELVLLDLEAQTSSLVHRGKLYNARISGSTVVWQSLNDAGQKVITIMSTTGGTPRTIEDVSRPESAAETSPRISGNDLVFLRQDLMTREFTFMYYDVIAGTIESLPITSPSPTRFDLSDGKLVYMKEKDAGIYIMDLGEQAEYHWVDVSRVSEGPVIRGNIVAWTSHMPAEKFKAIAAQPLIDERDFRSLYRLDIDSGKSATLIRDRFMLRRVRISDDGKIYTVYPRKITTSPGAISDIVRF